MRLNLSSQIVLNKVPVDIYQPKTAVDRSELTRYEKIVTDIFPKTEDGASHIADQIEAEIKASDEDVKQAEKIDLDNFFDSEDESEESEDGSEEDGEAEEEQDEPDSGDADK